MDIGDQVFNKGDTRRIAGAFTNAADTATNPDSVTLRVTKPDGTARVVTYNAGSPTEVVQASTGNYYYDLVLDQVGEWFYQWEGTGAVMAIEPGQLLVKGTGY